MSFHALVECHRKLGIKGKKCRGEVCKVSLNSVPGAFTLQQGPRTAVLNLLINETY